MNDNFDTKSVKIGSKTFEVLACQTAADAVECWQDDSAAFSETVDAIVEYSPTLAARIAARWAELHEYYLIPHADYHRSRR